MRYLIILLLASLSFKVNAQPPRLLQASKVAAIDNFFLNNYKVDSISNDSNLTVCSEQNLVTQQAVKKYVKNTFATIAQNGNKLNITDTAAMLAAYLRSNVAQDTYATIRQDAAKVKYTDTAAMLAAYLRSNVAQATFATIAQNGNKLNITDTAAMLAAYLRSNVAQATYATLIQDAAKVKYTDTAAMLAAYLRSNVAQATYATIAQNANKLNITDTAAMLAAYLRSNVAAATYQPLLTNPITGTGSNGYFSYWSGTNTESYVSPLYFNSSNSRIGYNTTSPTTEFDFRKSTTGTGGPTLSLAGGNDGNGNLGGKIAFREELYRHTEVASIACERPGSGNVAQLNVYVEGSSAMLIDNTRNIGIGTTTTTDKVNINGNLSLITAGNKIKIATGTNASVGTVTLSSGTITVNTTAVTSSSIIFLTAQETGTYTGMLRVTARVNNTSFTITSTAITDNCVVAYQIFN